MKLINFFAIFISCTIISNNIQSQIDQTLIDTYSNKFNVVNVDQEDRPEENAIIVNLITKDSYIDQILHTAIDPATNKTIIYYLTRFGHEKFQNPKYAQRTKSLIMAAKSAQKLEKSNTLTQHNRTLKAQRAKRNEYLNNIARKTSARKIQKTFKHYLNSQHDEKIKHFKAQIEAFADISYQEFKELMCTGNYITETDWIYQFVELMTKRKIFKRNENKTINVDQFTQEFEEQISNPNDWIEQKIIQYLPEFHQAVEEVFIQKATNKIVQNELSWTDAVSISPLQDSDAEQFEDKRLYPQTITYQKSLSTTIALNNIFIETGDLNNQTTTNKIDKVSILAQIFENIIIADPLKIKELNPDPANILNRKKLINEIIVKQHELKINGLMAAMFKVKAFGEQIIIYIFHGFFDAESVDTELTEYIDMCLPYMLKMYLNQLGLPKADQALPEEYLTPEYVTLYSMFPTVTMRLLIHSATQEEIMNAKYPTPFKHFKHNGYVQYDKLFTPDKNILMQSNINWAVSAQQIFLLGQLIFDHNVLAFYKLGGQTWLEQQPQDIQTIINNLLTSRLRAMKKNFESQPRNLFRDLNAMDIEL